MKRFCILILVGCIAVTAGCKKDENKESKEKAQSPDQVEQKQHVTVVPQGGSDVRSPAVDSQTQKLTVDTAPTVICEKFIVAVRSRDNRGWEKLLTQMAERHIRAANLEMQIPGGPKSECSVGKATFNSARQDIAIVPCVVEQVEDGSHHSFEISYLLKKKNVGWRISGIIVPTESGSSDLLSFENTDDVAQIKASTRAEVASEPLGKELK